ncbi:hypothetical protein BAC2_01668 [uncultured bacterium]|nr:hypothetical protein BAC2_01668 [uncultured bacterium]
MRVCLYLLMLLLSAPLAAQLVTLKAVADPASAAPGAEVKLRLQFAVKKGFHAYHKDNPGYGKKLEISFSELSGLTQKGEAAWPKWHEWKDKDDPNWIEYELSDNFEIVYTFVVPASAKDKLKIAGKYEGQACDEKACTAVNGEFSTEISVGAAAPASDELIAVSAALSAEGGKAVPGKAATLTLHFIVADTFHVYAKGNPGIGKALEFELTQLSGLIKTDEKWPEYTVEFPDEKDKTWIEWELKGQFDIVLTFTVPSSAKDKLAVSGTFSAQVCDASACQDRAGTFSAEIAVQAAQAAAPSADTKALEDRIKTLADEVAALKKELTDSRKATNEMAKALKEYIASQHEKAAASGAKDEHGFYEDYDFALAEAKKQDKLLLIDFNGEY